MRTAGVAAPLARENRRSGKWGATAAAALAAFFGSLLLALAAGTAARLPWDDLRLHIAARAWPAAQATIRSVSLSERSYLAGPDGELASRLVLAVAYDYEVAGVAYEGRVASLDDTGEPHDRRLKTLYTRLNFALVTERPLPAFHDPRAPALAVLDAGFDRWRMARDGALSALGGLVGLWLVLVPLRGRRRAITAR